MVIMLQMVRISLKAFIEKVEIMNDHFGLGDDYFGPGDELVSIACAVLRKSLLGYN